MKIPTAERREVARLSGFDAGHGSMKDQGGALKTPGMPVRSSDPGHVNLSLGVSAYARAIWHRRCSPGTHPILTLVPRRERVVAKKGIIILILAVLCLLSCSQRYWEINCEDAAWSVCRSLDRQGIEAKVAICKTPWSESKGIYHAQCVARIEGKWRWMIMDRWPIIKQGQREYGDPVEYREVKP